MIFVSELVEKAENLIDRQIRSLEMNHYKFRKYIVYNQAPTVVLWNTKDYYVEALMNE